MNPRRAIFVFSQKYANFKFKFISRMLAPLDYMHMCKYLNTSTVHRHSGVLRKVGGLKKVGEPKTE